MGEKNQNRESVRAIRSGRMDTYVMVFAENGRAVLVKVSRAQAIRALRKANGPVKVEEVFGAWVIG